MIGEDFFEDASFESDGHLRAEKAVYGFTEHRQNRSVAAPFDEFEAAVALGEVAQVPMVPTLEMAFVDQTEAELPIEHPVKETEVRNSNENV